SGSDYSPFRARASQNCCTAEKRLWQLLSFSRATWRHCSIRHCAVFNEFRLLWNFITEPCRRPAAVKPRTHEDAARNRAGETGLFLVARDRFVDATLIVGRATEVSPFGHHFFTLRDPRVFVARDPIHAGNHDADHQHYNDNQDYE